MRYADWEREVAALCRSCRSRDGFLFDDCRKAATSRRHRRENKK